MRDFRNLVCLYIKTEKAPGVQQLIQMDKKHAVRFEYMLTYLQGVSWKTKVKSVFSELGKCCFYLQYFLYNIDNDKSKQKYTQSHSSYKIETFHF